MDLDDGFNNRAKKYYDMKSHKIKRINVDKEKLINVFLRYPDIQAVYLFGSQLTGEVHQESDLDLAVYPATEQCTKQKLNILADIVQAGYDNVDLIFIDEKSDLVLAFEAVHQNQIIYQADDFERGAVYSNIIRKYLDFLPFLTIQRKAYKERILHD